jgi:hypothetical protein
LIRMPLHADRTRRGARNNREDYLQPMSERWPGGDLRSLVDWLQVESSLRWQPRKRADGTIATYCDHYAADLIEQACGQQLISAWIWWADDAIRRLRAGEIVPVVYGQTVVEHGALGLYRWMQLWGDQYGWSRSGDDSSLRTEVSSRYTIGLILTPSHVSVVVPDSLEVSPGTLTPTSPPSPPLQSQAGSRNVRLWRQSDWYKTRTGVVRVWLDPSKLVNVTRPEK